MAVKEDYYKCEHFKNLHHCANAGSGGDIDTLKKCEMSINLKK